MPGKITKKTAYKKKSAMKKRAPRRRVPRSPRTFAQPEWASCSESLRQLNPGAEGNTLNTNVMYGPGTIQLGEYKRASAIAANYQQYRITGVTFRFTPRFDTFPANTDIATAISVPYFYYMVDKVGALRSNVTLSQLQQMGAKPHRFDDKTLTVKYRPAVSTTMVAADVTQVIGGQLKVSPWLNTMGNINSTDPAAISTVDHFGLWWILDAKGLPGDANYQYDLDVQVDFQFRKPLAFTSAGETQVQGGNVLPVSH